MERLRIIWHQFRRDEQWILVACALLLVCFGSYAIARRRSTPPLPPLFQDAPSVSNTATDNAVSPPAGGKVMVYVTGEVNKPGVLELPANARVVDAIHKAGGPTKDGDVEALNLAARVEDGQKITVAKRGAPGEVVKGATTLVPPRSSTPEAAKGTASSAKKQPAGPINVNTADASQLSTLPGVGPKTAATIIEYRQKNGAFRSMQDLDKVKGLGPKKLEKMAPYVVF